MKLCRDCKIEISEHSNHIGNEFWCEECFDNGLQKDMDEHFKKFVDRELKEIKNEISNG